MDRNRLKSRLPVSSNKKDLKGVQKKDGRVKPTKRLVRKRYLGRRSLPLEMKRLTTTDGFWSSPHDVRASRSSSTTSLPEHAGVASKSKPTQPLALKDSSQKAESSSSLDRKTPKRKRESRKESSSAPRPAQKSTNELKRLQTTEGFWSPGINDPAPVADSSKSADTDKDSSSSRPLSISMSELRRLQTTEGFWSPSYTDTPSKQSSRDTSPSSTCSSMDRVSRRASGKRGENTKSEEDLKSKETKHVKDTKHGENAKSEDLKSKVSKKVKDGKRGENAKSEEDFKSKETKKVKEGKRGENAKSEENLKSKESKHVKDSKHGEKTKSEEDLKSKETKKVKDSISLKKTRSSLSVLESENTKHTPTSKQKTSVDTKQLSSSSGSKSEPPPKRVKVAEGSRKTKGNSLTLKSNKSPIGSTTNQDNRTKGKKIVGLDAKGVRLTAANLLHQRELRRLNTTDGFWSPTPHLSHALDPSRQNRTIRTRPAKSQNQLLEHRKRKLKKMKLISRNQNRQLQGKDVGETSEVHKEVVNDQKQTDSLAQGDNKPVGKETVKKRFVFGAKKRKNKHKRLHHQKLAMSESGSTASSSLSTEQSEHGEDHSTNAAKHSLPSVQEKLAPNMSKKWTKSLLRSRKKTRDKDRQLLGRSKISSCSKGNNMNELSVVQMECEETASKDMNKASNLSETSNKRDVMKPSKSRSTEAMNTVVPKKEGSHRESRSLKAGTVRPHTHVRRRAFMRGKKVFTAEMKGMLTREMRGLFASGKDSQVLVSSTKETTKEHSTATKAKELPDVKTRESIKRGSGKDSLESLSRETTVEQSIEPKAKQLPDVKTRESIKRVNRKDSLLSPSRETKGEQSREAKAKQPLDVKMRALVKQESSQDMPETRKSKSRSSTKKTADTGVSTENFSSMSSEGPTDTSSEVHADVSAEVHADASSTVHADVSSEVHADVSSEVHIDVSSEVHAAASSDIHVDVSSEVHADVSSENDASEPSTEQLVLENSSNIFDIMALSTANVYGKATMVTAKIDSQKPQPVFHSETIKTLLPKEEASVKKDVKGTPESAEDLEKKACLLKMTRAASKSISFTFNISSSSKDAQIESALSLKEGLSKDGHNELESVNEDVLKSVTVENSYLTESGKESQDEERPEEALMEVGLPSDVEANDVISGTDVQISVKTDAPCEAVDIKAVATTDEESKEVLTESDRDVKPLKEGSKGDTSERTKSQAETMSDVVCQSFEDSTGIINEKGDLTIPEPSASSFKDEKDNIIQEKTAIKPMNITNVKEAQTDSNTDANVVNKACQDPSTEINSEFNSGQDKEDRNIVNAIDSSQFLLDSEDALKTLKSDAVPLNTKPAPCVSPKEPNCTNESVSVAQVNDDEVEMNKDSKVPLDCNRDDNAGKTLSTPQTLPLPDENQSLDNQLGESSSYIDQSGGEVEESLELTSDQCQEEKVDKGISKEQSEQTPTGFQSSFISQETLQAWNLPGDVSPEERSSSVKVPEPEEGTRESCTAQSEQDLVDRCQVQPVESNPVLPCKEKGFQRQLSSTIPSPLRKVRKRRHNLWRRGVLKKVKQVSTQINQLQVSSDASSKEGTQSQPQVKRRLPSSGAHKLRLSQPHSNSMAELAMQATKIIQVSPDSDRPKKLMKALKRLRTDANLANASIDDKNLQTRARKGLFSISKPGPSERRKLITGTPESPMTVSESVKLPNGKSISTLPCDLSHIEISKEVVLKPEERSLPKLSPLGLTFTKPDPVSLNDTAPPVLTPQKSIDYFEGFGMVGNGDDEVVNESVDDTDFHLYLSGASDEDDADDVQNVPSANILSGSSKINQGKSLQVPAALSTTSDAPPASSDADAPSDQGASLFAAPVARRPKMKGKRGRPPGIPVSRRDIFIQPSKTARKSISSVDRTPSPQRTFEFRKKSTRSPLEMLEMKRKQEEAIYDLEMERLEARKINRREKRTARVPTESFTEDELSCFIGVRPCSVVLSDFVKKLNLDQSVANLYDDLPSSPYSIQYQDDLADEDWCADLEDVVDEDEDVEVGREKRDSHKRPYIPRLKLKRIPKKGKASPGHSMVRNLVSEMKSPEQEPLKLVIKSEASSDAEEPSRFITSEPQASTVYESNYLEFLKQRSLKTSGPASKQEAARKMDKASRSPRSKHDSSDVPSRACTQATMMVLTPAASTESASGHPTSKSNTSDETDPLTTVDLNGISQSVILDDPSLAKTTTEDSQPPLLETTDVGQGEEEEDLLILDLSGQDCNQDEGPSIEKSGVLTQTNQAMISGSLDTEGKVADDKPVNETQKMLLIGSQEREKSQFAPKPCGEQNVTDKNQEIVVTEGNNNDNMQTLSINLGTVIESEQPPRSNSNKASTPKETLSAAGFGAEINDVQHETAKDADNATTKVSDPFGQVSKEDSSNSKRENGSNQVENAGSEPLTISTEAVNSNKDASSSPEVASPVSQAQQSSNNNNNSVKPCSAPTSVDSSSPVHSTSQDHSEDSSRKRKTIPLNYKQMSGSYKCKRCNFTAVSKLSIESHIYSHIPGVHFQCFNCQSEFGSMIAIFNHFRNVHVSLEIIEFYVSCHVDEGNFYTTSTEKQEGEEDTAARGTDSQSPPFIISLVVSGSGARSVRTSSTASRRFVCTHCGFATNVKEDVQQHVSDLHASQPIYTCTLCKDSVGLSESEIREHSASIHPSRQRPYVKLPDFYDAEQLAMMEKGDGKLEERGGNVLRVSTLFAPGDESPREDLTPAGHQLKAKDYLFLQEGWKGKTSAEADSTTTSDYSDETLAGRAAENETDETPQDIGTKEDENGSSEAKSSSKAAEGSPEAQPGLGSAEEASSDASQLKIAQVVSLSGVGQASEDDPTTSAIVPGPQTTCEEFNTVDPGRQTDKTHIGVNMSSASPQTTAVSEAFVAHSSASISVTASPSSSLISKPSFGVAGVKSSTSVLSSSKESDNLVTITSVSGHSVAVVSISGQISVSSPIVSRVTASSCIPSSTTSSSSTTVTQTTTPEVSLTSSLLSTITTSSLQTSPKPSSSSSSSSNSSFSSSSSSTTPSAIKTLSSDVSQKEDQNAPEVDAVLRAPAASSALQSQPQLPPSSSPSSVAGGLPLSYQCKACKVHTPYLLMMVRHLKSRHPKILCFSCPYCKSTLSFNTQKQLRHHVRAAHPEKADKNEMSLSEEAKKFVEAMVLPKSQQCSRVGNRLILEEDIHTCTICSLRMTSLSSVYDHLNEKHADLFEFVCPSCQTFKNKSLQVVADHCMAIHHSELDKDKVHVSVPKYLFTVLSCISKQGKYIEKALLTAPTNPGATPSSTKDSSPNPSKNGGELGVSSTRDDNRQVADSRLQPVTPKMTPTAAKEPHPVQAEHRPSPAKEAPAPPPAHRIPPSTMSALASAIPLNILMGQTPMVAIPIIASTTIATATTRSMVAISSSLFDTTSLSVPRLASSVSVPAEQSSSTTVIQKNSPQVMVQQRAAKLPVLNVPTIRPRSASVVQQPPPQPPSAERPSSRDTTTYPRASSASLTGQGTLMSIDQLPEDEPNPDAFKIFNLRPSGVTPPVLSNPASVQQQQQQQQQQGTPSVFPPVSSAVSLPSGFIPGPMAGFPAAMVIPPTLIHSAFPFALAGLPNPARGIAPNSTGSSSSSNSSSHQGKYPVPGFQALAPMPGQFPAPHLQSLAKTTQQRPVFVGQQQQQQQRQQMIAPHTLGNSASAALPLMHRPPQQQQQPPMHPQSSRFPHHNIPSIIHQHLRPPTPSEDGSGGRRPSPRPSSASSSTSSSPFASPHPGSSPYPMASSSSASSSNAAFKKGRKSTTLYTCPYCVNSQHFKALELASHIPQAHPGRQIYFQKVP